MNTTEAWRDEAANELFQAILRLRTVEEASAFFRDLCTLGELHDMAQRWAVVRMLDEGMHYAEISRVSGASTATITRIAQWLHHGEGGYPTALQRMKDTNARASRDGAGPASKAPSPAGGSAADAAAADVARSEAPRAGNAR